VLKLLPLPGRQGTSNSPPLQAQVSPQIVFFPLPTTNRTLEQTGVQQKLLKQLPPWSQRYSLLPYLQVSPQNVFSPSPTTNRPLWSRPEWLLCMLGGIQAQNSCQVAKVCQEESGIKTAVVMAKVCQEESVHKTAVVMAKVCREESRI